jgi:hypothetical protein
MQELDRAALNLFPRSGRIIDRQRLDGGLGLAASGTREARHGVSRAHREFVSLDSDSDATIGTDRQ